MTYELKLSKRPKWKRKTYELFDRLMKYPLPRNSPYHWTIGKILSSKSLEPPMTYELKLSKRPKWKRKMYEMFNRCMKYPLLPRNSPYH
ncbi:hypothetical protein CEXT_179871 [Caerostris extrusa]|uniref:Uncharacterized protein n=1 Tax=Caerostris extrusa TaxID=172846 RepID=A0AAV4NP71_CAEEX|nr:hypothetical protein CEXT_179871 [Caerostris extrusa]